MISNSDQNNYRILSFLTDMRMPEETYERFKNVFHPKLRKNIKKFKHGAYFRFPLYHGCGKKNRNGTNKKINYSVGEMCISPTYTLLPKTNKVKFKYLPQKIYFTRYGGQFGMKNFVKSKGKKWFDWDRGQFFEREVWIELGRKAL